MTDPTPAELEVSAPETIDIDHNGHTYTFPFFTDPDDLDGDLIDALESNLFGKALQGVLGAKQWAAFKTTKPKMRDYKALMTAWMERITGGSLGE